MFASLLDFAVGVAVGAVLAVAVPAVYRFAAKQFGWAKAEVGVAEATVKADVAKKL